MSSNETSFNGKPLVLEVYLKLLESIEKNIDRRYQVNQFNLSALAALAVAFAFVSKGTSQSGSVTRAETGNLLVVAACVMCLVWIFQILRFREISRVKHEAAMKLEEEMQVYGISIENEIELKTRQFISFTLLEIFFPSVVLAGCLVFLLFF